MAKEHTNSRNSRRGMSRQEAGRKGGKAPHVCRGRQCSKRSSFNNNY